MFFSGYPVPDQYLPSFEQIKKIKENLKIVKDEWLEVKPKMNQKYIGISTVRQILDYAVEGITYWDFDITDQWRDEVYKFNKQSNQYYFDGYVYHVRGSLFIPGLGRKTQFGCKVAVGGKDNQDSAYKAAASNCLAKCASLFGVGHDVYSKFTIDFSDDDKQYQQMVESPNYYVQNSNQQAQSVNSWGQQWGNPNQPPNGFQQADENIDYPFENVPEQNKYEAQPQQVNIQENQAAQPNSYQAQPQQFGPPQDQNAQDKPEKKSAIPAQWDPNEIQRIHAHKARLNIQSDEELIPFLRDYFKTESASLDLITPETLKGFNDHLDKIQA